jgi:ketosteroid isomerase-like protein
MSAENVEIVREIFRAWEKGGSPLDSGLLADDIEWVNAKEAIEPGTRKGVEAFGEAAAGVASTFEDTRIEFERFVDAGDRDGTAVRFQWFNDAGEALAAAGIED